MRASQAAAALTLANGVSAFWRMPCRSQTGIARMDPLVDPGVIADHVHTIHGGGNFGFETTFEDLTAPGSCTSCGVTKDKSAYWTPTLHFQYSNGTTVMVPQVGGMLAYYLLYLDNLKAFPSGFQMLAGTRDWRSFNGSAHDIPLSYWPQDASDQKFLEQRALGFNCLNYAKDPEPSLYRHTFPNKTMLDNECTDGVRFELAFPSCGKKGEIDSDDHKSHMAYPNLVKEGNCPEGYDVHYPFLFFETIWATNTFAGEDGHFALSHGDPTGCGYHGDFIMGWESEEYLESAIAQCNDASGSGTIQDCKVFNRMLNGNTSDTDIQSDSDAAQCKFDIPEVLKNDDVSGPRDGLAVDVPMQWGPQDATPYPCAGRSGEPTSKMSSAYSEPSSIYQLPTYSYSAADPSETATAQGGIVVHKYKSGSATEDSSSTEAPSSTITASPSLSDAQSPEVVTTSYITKGNDVIELVIEEVDVTVTASADPTAGAKHRRHVHQHIHKNAAH